MRYKVRYVETLDVLFSKHREKFVGMKKMVLLLQSFLAGVHEAEWVEGSAGQEG